MRASLLWTLYFWSSRAYCIRSVMLRITTRATIGLSLLLVSGLPNFGQCLNLGCAIVSSTSDRVPPCCIPESHEP
jgi:hypothetical protein